MLIAVRKPARVQSRGRADRWNAPTGFRVRELTQPKKGKTGLRMGPGVWSKFTV